MSIFPPTDLVTEVARAADPQRLSAAVHRLSEISGARLHAKDDFAEAITGVDGVAGGAVANSAAARAGGPPRVTQHTKSTDSKAQGATRQFEAFIIQSCLETILPKADQATFGSGSAGGIWRSIMAEKIGDQIAKAGGLGLQRLLDHRWSGASGDTALSTTSKGDSAT